MTGLNSLSSSQAKINSSGEIVATTLF